MISKEKYPYKYLCVYCDEVCFYYDNHPGKGDTVKSEMAMTDGGKPNPGQEISCPDCGRAQPTPLPLDRLRKRK